MDEGLQQSFNTLYNCKYIIIALSALFLSNIFPYAPSFDDMINDINTYLFELQLSYHISKITVEMTAPYITKIISITKTI